VFAGGKEDMCRVWVVASMNLEWRSPKLSVVDIEQVTSNPARLPHCSRERSFKSTDSTPFSYLDMSGLIEIVRLFTVGVNWQE